MKKRHLFFINAIFISFTLFSAGIVYQFMTGKRPLDTISNVFKREEKKPLVTTNKCSEKPPLSGLNGATNPHLRKLGQYQDACHSFASSTLMIFVDMPVSAPTAKSSAEKVAATLKGFSKAGVRPLVIAEPTTTWGNIDFAEFASGLYDPWIDAYFKELKALGITDQQMGIWNPFPEANLPYWNNNKAEYFSPNVTKFLTALRKYFPKTETSVLLSSATYEIDDFDWRNGDYASLIPYIKTIPKGLVTYAGLQGFPWLAPQGDPTSIFNGAEFVNSALLSEMADYLKTQKVWFNTGTFASKYTLDPAKMVTVSPERRKDILLTIKEEALKLKKKGYTVSINIFAEDKSETAEATDWSYWKGDKPFESSATPVLTDFIAGLPRGGIEFWLFDK